MSTNRRFIRSLLLAAGLAVCVATTAAGCGGSSTPTTSAGSPSPAKKPAPSSGSAQLPAVVSCFKSQGVAIPDGATDKQVRATFMALPKTQQQTVFAACASTLPPNLRQKLQTRVASQGSAATPAT
jgi:hypothetical protein